MKKESEIDWDTYELKSLPYRKHFWWESFLDVKKRAKNFLDFYLKNKSNESFLIVTQVYLYSWYYR